MALISPISVTQKIPTTFLQSEGGFLWWYVDVVNDDGDGVVLIFSFGLPFLPGYAHAARKKEGQTPESRPSVNVAVYQNGKPVFYSLEELHPDDVSWGENRQWTFGHSTLDIDVETGVCVVHLRCAVPGTSDLLEGTVMVRGTVPDIAFGEIGDHLWGPLLTPARGTVDLTFGDETFRFEGDGYVDRNGSEKPLHDLGFRSWTWGRVFDGSCEKVYYILWPVGDGDPTALGFEFHPKSVKQFALEATFANKREGFAGMPWHSSIALSKNGVPWLASDAIDVLDNGPFYIRGQFNAAGHRGVFEWCDPMRVDLSRHRFLVNMRVQNPRRNSMWVPLFTGPAKDRVSRLFKYWAGGA